MRLLQINLHHSKVASAALLNRMAVDQPDFVLIQEPWVNGGKICGLRTPTYKLYAASSEGKLRTCIMSKVQLNIFLMHHYSNEDVTTISWETGGSSYRLTSFYLAYDDPVPPQLLEKLVSESETSNCRLILGGDANAHHTIWGSSNINVRGELLFNYILNTKMLLCNRGNEPTFIIRNRQEVLDITLVSDSLIDKVVIWRVLNEHSFSDHRYIECIIEEEIPRPNLNRNFRKTDWQVYEHELKKRLPSYPFCNPDNVKDLDNIVESFTNSCNLSLKKACPLIKHRGKSKPPWWSPELNQLRKECRNQFNKAKYSCVEIEWNYYYDKLKVFKKHLRKAKRSSWRSFCGEIETAVETSRLRKILSKSTQTIGYLKKLDNTWTTSSEESLNLLLNTHFPGCSENRATEVVRNLETRIEPDILETISEASITWAVESFKPYKSPGPDGIFPAQLQRTLGYTMEWLITIFRSVLKLNYVPTLWREVKVVFIPKTGKSSHTGPKDFRPISLSSFLLKTLERLIDMHIRNYIPTSQFAKSQHAYSKGKSTESALNSLVSEIEKSIEDKEYTLVAFLDIEGAFNNILPKAITDALSDLRISEALVNFIEQLLLCRFVNSTLGNSEIRRSVHRGTPQGGVLSPLLWILAMNKLLLNLEERRIHVVAYADDVAVVLRGKFPDTLSDLMQGVLNDIYLWAKSCGLGLNANKTELVLFTKKHRLPDFRPPKLNGITLSVADKACYLGLILDRKLSWKLNVEDRVRKAAIALYSCKRTVGVNWGITPRIVHWLYTAVVRPIMTYGILVWWPTLEKKTTVKRMESIQRAASLCISRALRTTPTAALNIILHLVPIDLYGKQIAAISALRLRELSLLSFNNKGHSCILSKFPLIPNTTDSCDSAVSHLVNYFTTIIPSKEDWDNGLINCNKGISIYTDGSKLNDKVGGGVYSEKLGTSISFRLPDHCSVFQAEILAIKESLLTLGKNVFTSREIYIYSDSQAALRSLKAFRHTSKTVKECRELLDVLTSYFTINLLWVPGHRNIKGNCKADELARLGTMLPICPEKENIHMPIATCKLLINNYTTDSANTRWKQSTTCVTSRQTWPELNMGRTTCLLKFSSTDIRILIGVLTGHCILGRHADRMGAPFHDYCRSCQDVDEEENVEHLLCRCMALGRRRFQFLGLYFLDNITEVADIKLTKVVSYIKATGWFKNNPEEE